MTRTDVVDSLAVLVLEPDGARRAATARLLGDAGRGDDVRWATTLEELRGLEGDEFDVVLLAERLPDGRGPAAVRAVCGRLPAAAVVVLADDTAGEIGLLEAGADEVLLGRAVTGGVLERVLARAVTRARRRTATASEGERFRREAECARADLERVAFLKQALLGNVSHQLRDPLTVMLGFARALADADGELPEELRREFADRLCDAGDRMASVLDDLLLLVAPTPSPELHAELVDLRALLLTAVAGATLGSREATVQSEAASVRLVPTTTRRIIARLLENVRAHTPDRTRVAVRAVVHGGRLLLAVEDDGPGVPPARLATIFDPFTVGTDGPGLVPGGLGIGLSVVEHLVRSQGGRTWAEPRRPHGLRVCVELPVGPEDGAPAGDAVATVAAPTTDGARPQPSLTT